MMNEYDDYCYECKGYGDDYYVNDDGELVPSCKECWINMVAENDE